MSDTVTLTLRSVPSERLEADSIAPHRFADLDEREIALLPVWAGPRAASVGDFFDVRGARSSRAVVSGDLGRVDGLGSDTAGGSLVIEGNAGDRVAARMTGGTVEVHGGVQDDAGMAMSGGVLYVHGDTGDRLGGATPGASKGMLGGEIVVTGSAGAEAAARVRRGLVVVAGDVGERAARAMIAGTLVVLGRIGARAARGSKRGSVVAVGEIDVPPTYQYACTYQPTIVRLLMTYLRRCHGLSIDEEVVHGQYRRWCGDASDPGKGEILAWIRQ